MDRSAIDEFGIAGFTLMERAGAAALRALRRRWPEVRALRVYCGVGNNAGDGFVVAKLAHVDGLRVTVITCAAVEELRGDAATAARDCSAAGVTILPFSAAAPIPDDEIVVDALFGIGLSRPLTGQFAAAVRQIAAADCPVVALDMPSGLDADTGRADGPVICAERTIAFVGLKTGYFLGVGTDQCGSIEFADIGIPPGIAARLTPAMQRLSLADIRAALPPRRRTAHKGSNGRLLVIGGGPDMAGAVRMAGEAALRTGAGLVHLATHPRHAAFIAAQVPELIVHAVDNTAVLEAAGIDFDAIALGPGLGRTPWAESLCEWAYAQPCPLVNDADGLNWLADAGDLGVQAQPRIMTPHPGEAARLLGISTQAVQRDRLHSVRELAERYAATIILKGAGTLVSGPAADDGPVADKGTAPVSVCLAGNPGMASAGTGDVLTGIVGSVLVQSGDAGAAARAAVLIHSLAGDAAAAARGERGLIATDVIDAIQRWVNPSS